LPRIDVRRLALDDAAFQETLEEAAEVAGIDPEILGEIGRGRRLAMRQLVDDPRLGQRELAAVIALVQHADLARVEPRKAPHCLDAQGLLLHASLSGKPHSCRR